MPKTATIQTNFTGGELSPFLLGRVDVAKYSNGVARMENFNPIVQGGAVSRDGTRLIGSPKGLSRLIPFVVERKVAYQIELGNFYIRIWRANRTQVMAYTAGPSKKHILTEGYADTSGLVETGQLELVTPYPEGIRFEVTYEQAQDTMFFFHKNYPPMRLQRLDDISWRLEEIPFVTHPFSERGISSSIDLTLSSAAVGSRTVTAASAIFLASDVGRDIESGTGSATITAYTSATQVTANVTRAFQSVSIDTWGMTDSPQAFVSAKDKEPIGTITVLSAALPRQATITLTDPDAGDAVTITANPGIFVAGDSNKWLYADSGSVELVYVSATQCTGTNTTTFLRTEYQAGAWGITGDAFRSTDVGGYVRMNGGLLRITSYTDATKVSAEIKAPTTAIVAAPPGAWSLETPSFDGDAGYPRCGALHEQRLYLAATIADPQTILASRIGEYLDFEPGLLDADGFSYALNTRQRNPILHLVSGKRLFAFTTGLEASLRGGNEKAIGPTNIQKENESEYGASEVRPVVIGKEVLYVQGAGRKIRAFGYSVDVDGFASPDRTVFAEHVTSSGVVDMAYQAQPGSLGYCVRTDGQMAVTAYDVSQEVIAWARYVTAGSYKSVSVVPTDTRDDVWVVVDRPLNNVSRYFIEVFEDSLATDCASTFASPVVISSVSGLSRFEGVPLAVKVNGTYQGTQIPAGGVVPISPSLPTETITVEAGLPYDCEIEMLPPDLGDGRVQGSNVSVHEVVIRLLDTKDIEINGTLSDFRRFGSELLDRPPPGLTGDFREIKLTDNFIRDHLVIRQPLPYKAHVQAVIRKVTVNDL